MKGYTEVELVNMIYDENEDLQPALGPSFLYDTKEVKQE